MGEAKERAVSPFDLFFWSAGLAFTVYQLVHAQGTAGRVVWGVLAVASLLMVALNLIAMAFGQTTERAGEQIDTLNRTMYGGAHTRRVVDAGEIERLGLDAAFYDREQAEMERLGFRHLADYVDDTAAVAVPGARAVLRTLLSRDGTTMSAIYDVRLRGWMRLLQLVRLLPPDLRCVEFGVEFDDGSFVETGNAFAASTSSEFPDVSRRLLPARTPTADVYAAHEAHLAEVRVARPAATPVVHRDFRDVCAAQDRLDMLKSRHRNSADYDPAAELERIAGGNMSAADRELAADVARRHAERVAERAS